MEPFGLFQFLQTLLNAPTPEKSKTTELSETEAPMQKTGTTPQKSEEKTASQNAAAQFLVDHERRAQRTKKR